MSYYCFGSRHEKGPDRRRLKRAAAGQPVGESSCGNLGGLRLVAPRIRTRPVQSRSSAILATFGVWRACSVLALSFGSSRCPMFFRFMPRLALSRTIKVWGPTVVGSSFHRVVFWMVIALQLSTLASERRESFHR